MSQKIKNICKLFDIYSLESILDGDMKLSDENIQILLNCDDRDMFHLTIYFYNKYDICCTHIDRYYQNGILELHINDCITNENMCIKFENTIKKNISTKSARKIV